MDRQYSSLEEACQVIEVRPCHAWESTKQGMIPIERFGRRFLEPNRAIGTMAVDAFGGGMRRTGARRMICGDGVVADRRRHGRQFAVALSRKGQWRLPPAADG